MNQEIGKMNGAAMPNGNEKRPAGNALIIALTIVALLASFASVLVSEMMLRAKRVEIDLEDIKAFEAAEAGIDAALNDINSSPVYQPYMEVSATYPLETQANGTTIPNRNAPRTSNGVLNTVDGSLTSGNTIGARLISPWYDSSDKPKPINVHVARKADGNKPGCIGTSAWVAPTYVNGVRTSDGNDIDGNNRPTWRSQAMRNSSGNVLKYSSGPNSGHDRFCEDNITPLSLGNVAYFTYAIDWFHDGVDNDNDGHADDRNERNKYTIYSTGIHRGIQQSGVTESGRIVTIEVNVQSLDRDNNLPDSGPFIVPIHPR
jgi:Tfp pilus assembly protein PilX